MGLPQIISRNQAQKILSVPVSGRVVIQPNTWYTCPTAKKAICKGRVQCTGLGAAANASFEVAGVIMYTWIAAVPAGDYSEFPRDLGVSNEQMALFEFELAAGEFIRTIQNTGTNSEFNLWMEVTESPV